MSIGRKLLSPIVELREEETATALLMFAYTFLLMWSYNIIKPITRSAFIKDLGADNIPWMPLVASFLIAALMAGYTWLVSKLPRRWALPVIQLGMAAVLVAFWFLFKSESKIVAAGFYLWGLLLGVLLTSQFWTLANVTYDPRQAKRIFGFIGGGAPLGGFAGAYMAYQADFFGTFNLLLYSAALLAVGVLVVSVILAREKVSGAVTLSAEAEKGGDPDTVDLLTGAILAVSRAIGETAPLILVGAVTFINFAPDGLDSPYSALPIQIFDWTSRPQKAFLVNAAAGIVVLMIALLLLNSVAIWLRNRYQKRAY